MKIEIKKLEKSKVEITVVVPEKDFSAYHDRGLKKVQELVEADGFRKGNVPENIIVGKYGEMAILEEMANMCIRDAYIKAIDDNKIIPVADPKINITKIAKGNPLEFTIIVSVMPEVKLPNYKKLAQEKIKEAGVIEEVTDKEIEDVIEELRKGRAKYQEHEHTDVEHEHKIDESTIPELNDEFAQSFGENFKSVDDLKNKVRENLKLEKEQKHHEKSRTAILEGIIGETKTDLPDEMVEQELERMFAQMKHDITRFGGTWEEYLKHSNKTEENIKEDWRKDAVKRTMSQLVLAEISLLEKIKPTDVEVETELVRLLATMQDVDEERAKAYLYQALSNEKVLTFLEENN